MRTAAILAGGRSSRMGRDKVMLPIGEKAGRPVTMLEQVVGVAREVCERVVVLGDVREGVEGVEWLPDPEGERFGGPMPALKRVLERVGGEVVLMAADMPLVTRELLLELLRVHERGGGVATLAVVEGFVQPMPGVFGAGVLPLLEELMGRGAFQPLRGRKEVVVWEAGAEWAGQFLNVNTVEALEEARRVLGGGGGER